MAVTFNQAVQELLRVCLGHAGFTDLERACVVRDLTGVLHLVVEPKRNAAFEPGGLEEKLRNALGGYFAPPILSTAEPQERGRLARSVMERSSPWPSSWPTEIEDPLTGAREPVDGARWRSVQRVLSKESWLGATCDPPWPALEKKTPTIASFYSFKGGVGRSTVLAAVARRLAAGGKRVCVVDLDLEAPGLGVLFGVDPAAGYGVLDFMVDHLATDGKAMDLAKYKALPGALPPQEQKQVDVFAAGQLDLSALEKLARLDYASIRSDGTGSSPVETALRALLSMIRSQLKPDFILLDSRAGLHDLGGLSLHALSHVEVLVSRASPQAIPGLSLALQVLAKRRRAEELRCMVVHTLAPLPADEGLGKQEREWFRAEAYQLFNQHVYPFMEQESPLEGDDTAPHFPQVISRRSELENIRTVRDFPQTVLGSEEFQKLERRLRELAGSLVDTQEEESEDGAP